MGFLVYTMGLPVELAMAAQIQVATLGSVVLSSLRASSLRHSETESDRWRRKMNVIV